MDNPSGLATLFVGFLLGFLSSAAFWYALIAVRPTLQFATRVAFCDRTGALGVKIVNRTFAQVTDVEVRMRVADRTEARHVLTRVVGDLVTPLLAALDPKRTYAKPWAFPVAFVFACRNGREMLASLQNESLSPHERRLLVEVTTRHAISGTKHVTRRVYRLGDVEPGWYDRGLSLTIDLHSMYLAGPELTPVGVRHIPPN